MADCTNNPYNHPPILSPPVTVENTPVLRKLEHIGVLQSEKRGREVLYRHPALLEVLTV